jgi:hypothetical protein
MSDSAKELLSKAVYIISEILSEAPTEEIFIESRYGVLKAIMEGSDSMRYPEKTTAEPVVIE